MITIIPKRQQRPSSTCTNVTNNDTTKDEVWHLQDDSDEGEAMHDETAFKRNEQLVVSIRNQPDSRRRNQAS